MRCMTCSCLTQLRKCKTFPRHDTDISSSRMEAHVPYADAVVWLKGFHAFLAGISACFPRGDDGDLMIAWILACWLYKIELEAQH